MWADDPTVTITISSFTDLPTSGSATYGTYSWTANGVSGKGQICANSSSTSLQMNGGNANGKIIYNTTAIPGSIKKINLIKASGSNRSYSVYGRTSAFSGSGTEYGTLIATSNIEDGTGRDYTVATGDYNYFVVVNNASKAAYLASITVTYEVLTKHTLSSAVSPTGVGTVTLGATSIGEGKSTTIEATVTNPAYRFKNWTKTSGTIADADAASTTFTMGTEDATVTANFEEIPSHTLSSAITPVGAGTVTFGSASVKEGATTTATAAANAGYEFTGWSISGEGATLSSTTDNPTTVTMGTADATVTATFTAVTTHEINWSVNGTIVKTENIKEGNALSFAAPASGIPAGYAFRGWVTEANKIDTPTDVDPSSNYVTSGNSTTDITYYAVIAVVTGGTPASLTKMVKGDTFAADDKVVIVAAIDESTNYALYQETTNSSYVKNYSFTESVESVASNDKNWWTVSAGTGSTWKLGDATNGYLYSSGSNNLSVDTENASEWTLEDNEDGTFSLTQGRYLSCRSDLSETNQYLYRLAGGTPAGVYKLNIYKYVAGNATYANYCTTLPASISITPGNTYTTLTSKYPLDFTSVSGDLKAYIITDDDVSDNAVTLSEISQVPANTGLVVKATSKGSPVDVPVLTGAAEDVTGNLMVGSAFSTTAIAANAGYILKDGVFHPASAGTLAAGKAYLNIAVSAGASALNLDFGGEVTGVNEVREVSEVNDNSWYNLAGQRVAQPTKGLYIVNGKKVIIK